MSTQTIEAEVVPVVDAEIVTVDTSLSPYLNDRDTLERMVRTYGAYADSAIAQSVHDDVTKRQAVALIRKWKGDRKTAIEFFTPIKRSIDRVKQIALDMEKHTLALIDGPVAVLVGRVGEYDHFVAEQKERRRRQLEEEERDRLLRAAEDAAAIAAVQAEDEALMAALVGEAPVISEALAPMAVDLAAIEEQARVAAAEIATEPERAEGQYFVDATTVVLHDLDALIDAVIAGTVPRAALAFNETFINAQAKAMGEALGYPGVTVTVTQVPRYRAS